MSSAYWSGSPRTTAVGTSNFSTIRANRVAATYWTPYPGTSGMVISTGSLFGQINGPWDFRNRRTSGDYTPTNANLTTAFTQSFQSLGGTMEFTASASTLRMFGGDGILIEGGGGVNFSLLNASNINDLRAENAYFSTLYASTFVVSGFVSTFSENIIASSITTEIVNSITGNFATLNSSTINAATGNISTILTSNLTAANATISTINTSTINGLKGNISTILTSNLTGANATISTINSSTINGLRGNISTILTSNLTAANASFSGPLNMNNNSITNVNTITATTGDFTFGVSAPNATFTGLTAGSANITSLTGGASGTNGTFADLTVNNNAVFNNSITDFKRHTLSNVNTIHSGGSGVNLSNITLTATNALLGYGGNVEFDANQGSLVAANSVVTLKAKNGNRGKIVLDAEPGYAGIQGEINLTATGGTPPSATSLGGRIHLAATTPNPLTTVSPSYVLQTADSILAYAGALTPISGNYGYNYQQGLNGVNIVAGTVASIPNVLGTVYLYGTNLAGTGNSGGVRITNGLSVDVIYPYPTGFITPSYDLILKGNAAGNKVSLSNVRNIQSDGGDLNGFYTAYSSNLGSQIFTTSNLTASNTGFISSLTVNQLIGVPTSISTFSTLTSQTGLISSLRVNELIGVPYLSTSISTFSIVTSDSLSTNKLSTGQAFINLLTTSNLTVSNTAFISSLTVNDIIFSRQIEDFSILNVSSLFASTITSRSAFIDSTSTNKISTGSLFVDNAIINNLFTFSSITTVSYIDTIFTSTISTNYIIANDATFLQLNTSNITLQNTPSFSIEQSFFSTTTAGFNAISSVKNLILSTSIELTSGTQETQPFIPQYQVSATNVGQWGSTIFLLTTSREGTQNFLGNITTLGGGQVNYSNLSTRALTLVNQTGGGNFTVPVGCNYQYRWSGSAWSQITNPVATTATFGTSFSLFQTVNNTTLQTPDILTLDAGNIVFAGAVSLSNLVATEAFFQSTTTSNLSATAINTEQLTACNTNMSNLTASNINYFQLDGNVAYDSTGIFQTSTNPNIGARIKYNGPDTELFYLNAYPWVTGLGTTTNIQTQLNYTAYPGGNFTLISTPSTIVGTVLNADGTITSLANTFSNTWISSIMGVYGGTIANPVQITIASGFSSEFILRGLAPVEGRYEFIFGGLGYNIAIPFGQYHKWTYTGPGFTSNLSATPYATVPGQDTFQLIQSPGGRNTFQGSNFDFNFLPIIQYSESQNGSIGAAGPGGVYGRATLSNIPIQYQGVRIRADDYVVKVSFSGYFCDQASLAVTSVNANVTQDGDYLVLRLTLDTATAAGTTGCHWYYDVVCTPKCLAPNAVNSVAPFEDKGPWIAPLYPVLQLSSIITSTITMTATENLIFASGVGVPTVLGNEGISFTANSNIGIVANNDIGITSFNNMFLTTTSSIALSNVAGTLGLGFDESGATYCFGSNVVSYALLDSFIDAERDLVLNGSNTVIGAANDLIISGLNVITIESLSTINTTSYNYYQAASNLTELHNENYSNTSRTSANHITPDFRVSTCLNSYYIKNVRQPFIQYGDITGSSNTGSGQVVLPVPYSSINAYKAFATMEDSEPAEISVVRDSESTFTIYWQQAASGTHTIAWNTMGDVECGGGAEPPPPPAESAAYDLVNTIIGDTGDFSWTQDSTPDLETVYVLQSADDVDYATYTTADVYTPYASFYSLPQGYWYKFYVSSHYGGTRVDSSNSYADYVNYA